MDKITQLLSIRASGYVKRWHTLPCIGVQSNAEHSAQALSLLFLLHPAPSPGLAMAVLWHDSAELEVGDVPAPILRAMPEFAAWYHQAENHFFAKHPTLKVVMESLTDDDKKWLKAVDRLDLLLFCYDQLKLGNSHFEVVRHRAMKYILENPDTPEIISTLIREHLTFDRMMK